MKRRAFMAALGAGLAGLAGCAPSSQPLAGVPKGDRLFIPGYRTKDARIAGQPALGLLPGLGPKAAGDTTLLTRVDPDGAVVQAIYPITGHDVTISPDGRVGFFGRMGVAEIRGGAHHIAFDPDTLEEVARGKPLKTGWRGGGHGLFLPDGSALLTAERAPLTGYRQHPEAHYGRIALRDPITLRVIDSIPCHGIDPHEIRLMPGGRQIAVANYGSVAAPGTADLSVPRRVVEACVTIVDLESGALVARHRSTGPEVELRHLALAADGGLFGIRVRLGPPGSEAAGAGPQPETDLTADPGEVYLPAAPLLVVAGAAGVTAGSGTEPDHLRHGLSVEYDPAADEFIATFPSSHRLMVFDARSGDLRQDIDTARLGLQYPCGLALLADGQTYAVAGYWQDVMLFQRGSHRPLRRLTRHPVLYGHSHMTAA
jgi:hypothetical protein